LTNPARASPAAPVAWIFAACARIAAAAAAASWASTAPKYIASVSAYTCCITACGVLTRGSCLTVIGWLSLFPPTFSVTVYVPGETQGVVAPDGEL